MRKLEGYFEVGYDRQRKLIRIATYGFWNLDVVEQYAVALAEAHRMAAPNFDTLLNTHRTEVHSLEVCEALNRLQCGYKIAIPPRIGIVSPSILLRMQTKRMQSPEGIYAYFDTEEAALEWLAAPREEALAATE